MFPTLTPLFDITFSEFHSFPLFNFSDCLSSSKIFHLTLSAFFSSHFILWALQLVSERWMLEYTYICVVWTFEQPIGTGITNRNPTVMTKLNFDFSVFISQPCKINDGFFLFLYYFALIHISSCADCIRFRLISNFHLRTYFLFC